MYITAALITLLNIYIKTINSEECNHKTEQSKESSIDINNFVKITDDDIRFLLKAMDAHREVSRVHNSGKFCRSFKTCTECVKSSWYPCSWCHDYGCTDLKVCPLSHEISERNLSSCPYVDSKIPIFVHSGFKKHIQVKINVPSRVLEKELTCQIILKDRLARLKGVVLNNVVHCFPVKLLITDSIEVGSFNILWGGVQPLSNEIPLIVYRCDAMASNCEGCRLLPQEFGCGWCEDTQMCSLPDRCDDLLSWSFNRMTCLFNSNKQMYFV